jgi:hypothetical protein
MAFGPSSSGARKGAMFADHAVRTGMMEADNLLSGGFDTAASLYNQGLSGLKPLGETSQAGFQRYGDWSGANGAQGMQDARGMFDQSVYGTADKYGQQAVERSLGRMGQLGSGQGLAALNDYNKNDVIKRYQQYGAGLSPYNSIAPQVAGMEASQYQGLGNLAAQIASQRATNRSQGYNQIGQIQGNALAAGDQTRQQMTNLGMQGLGMLANGISSVAGGISGMGGLSGLFGGSTGNAPVAQYSGSGPILPGYNGQYLGAW